MTSLNRYPQTTQERRTYTLLRNVCNRQALLAYYISKAKGGAVVSIYHLHVAIVGRKTRRSAVATSAYHSAEKLHSDHDGVTHDYERSSVVNTSAYNSGGSLEHKGMDFDYTRKRGVVHTEIILPHNAPSEFKDRQTLWNAVECAEKRKDAQTARDIDVALPVELNRDEQINLVRDYVQENFVDKGMCADFAIHDTGKGNPHAHILLTTRDVDEDGFHKKNRAWNDRCCLHEWRENWANSCNEQLEGYGVDRIDHRTLKAQGIDREPTIHIGVTDKALEKKGIITKRVQKNRDIIARNERKKHVQNSERIAEHIHQLKERHYFLDKEITELQEIGNVAKRDMNIARITAEEIGERKAEILSMGSRVDELKAERQRNVELRSLITNASTGSVFGNSEYEALNFSTCLGLSTKRLRSNCPREPSARKKCIKFSP